MKPEKTGSEKEKKAGEENRVGQKQKTKFNKSDHYFASGKIKKY